MLSTMRSKVSGIFAKTLMMFLIITFAVWGIGDVVQGGASPNTIIKVGDSSITQQEFARQMQDIQRNAGDSIPPEILNSDMLRQQVLQRMVEDRLVEITAQDLGIVVGTDLIAKHTKQNLLFQNVNGSFNAQAFEAFLRESQLNETAYRQKVNKDMVRNLYMSSADLDQINLPASYLKLKSLSLGEQRRAKIITIAASSGSKAEEKDVIAYYDEVKESLYMRPETRTVHYAVISKASIEKATKGDTSGVAVEELGYTVEDTVAAGKSVADALSAANLDATSHTLSNVTLEDGKNALESTAIAEGFKLDEGEASGLMSDNEGTYFMVTVSDIVPASPKPFESVRDDVAGRFHAEKGAEMAKEKAIDLKTKLNSDDTLEAKVKTVQAAGAQLHDSPLLNRPGTATTSVKDVPDGLVRGIFSASQGDVVGPVQLASGGYALAIVSEIKVPKDAQEPDAATKTAMIGEMNNTIGNLWLNALTKRYDVKQVGSFTAQQPQE